MTSTARVRRHRRREATGLTLIRAEFHEADLTSTLIQAGVLDPNRADDPEAVSGALVRQIAVLAWAAEHEPKILHLLRRLASAID